MQTPENAATEETQGLQGLDVSAEKQTEAPSLLQKAAESVESFGSTVGDAALSVVMGSVSTLFKTSRTFFHMLSTGNELWLGMVFEKWPFCGQTC